MLAFQPSEPTGFIGMKGQKEQLPTNRDLGMSAPIRKRLFAPAGCSQSRHICVVRSPTEEAGGTVGDGRVSRA